MSCGINLQCDQLSYCDDYENKCKPCQDICPDSDLTECLTSCPHFISNILHSPQRVQPNQLTVLTIMVTLTVIMTSVVMVLLGILVMMKMKKKRRLIKKINPSVLFTVDKEKLDLSETKMKPLSAKDLGRREKQEIGSMRTMVTQISNESSNTSDNFPSGPLRNSGSLTSRSKRLPSEDCVPNFDRFNPGLNPTSEMSDRDPGVSPLRQYCEVV